MFESLDQEILQKFSNIEDRVVFKQDTKLTEVIGLLGTVSKECQENPGAAFVGSGTAQCVASGMVAAQRIVEKWWEKE